MPSKSITLTSGKSGVVDFSYTPTEARVHYVSVNGLTGSFEVMEAVGTGTLWGYVTDDDTGAVVTGQSIQLYRGDVKVTFDGTDAVGRYQIDNIPQGEYTLFTESNIYEPYSETITISPGSQRKDLRLTVKAAQPIPPLDVDLSVTIETAAAVICPGSFISIIATIHNKTLYEQSYDSACYVNDELVAKSTYNAIGANATLKDISSYIVPAIGSYIVRVTVDGFEAVTSFEAVEVPVGAPKMSIPKNIITADIITGNHCYCASLVGNIGDGEGDISCDWYLDGRYIETDSAHLVPGALAKFTLETIITIPGSYVVTAEFTWDGHAETRTGYFTAEKGKGPVGIGTVFGFVGAFSRTGGIPLPQASLSIEGWGSVPLDSKANYEVDLPAGRSWTFHCVCSGYRTVISDIEPIAGERIRRMFRMFPL